MERDDQGLKSGGELLSAISTRFVGLIRQHYGRGPTRAKTYILDDLVICVLRNGNTPLEKTLMVKGQGEDVVKLRHQFQTMMADQYKDMIEELTGVKVLAFMSQAHLDPDVTLEVFLVDRPLTGFGVIELGESVEQNTDGHGNADGQPSRDVSA